MTARRAGLAQITTRVDGLRLFARATPGGNAAPPLVLVHGLGVSSRYMVPLLHSLARAGRAGFAPDLPNHGRSERTAHALDIPALAEVLRDWMRGIGIARATLLGHSIGSQIVARLACAHAEMVDALVLAGPTVNPATRSRARLLARLVAGAPWERPSLAPVLARDYWSMGFRRIWEESRAMMADHIEATLPALRCPVLVVRGEHDHVAPARWADDAARLAGSPGAVTIAGGAHAINFSAPDALLRVIASFESTIRG